MNTAAADTAVPPLAPPQIRRRNATSPPSRGDPLATPITPTDTDSRSLSLLSAADAHPIAPVPSPGQHPEQYWNGRRETLGSWFAEFESVLAAANPDLHEFAVEFFVVERHCTVIFYPGQAAQLDGAIHRPVCSWEYPAPNDPAQYVVPHTATEHAYHHLYASRCLRDPGLDPTDPPDVPANAPYPVDDRKYVCSIAHLHSWNMRLRNAILAHISDLPIRCVLAREFPRDGHALLDKLRQQARVPLSNTQVQSVKADIDALTTAGIKSDTVESFREFGVIYHRLLARIPSTNPSRDPPAMQADRYVQAVMRGR